MSTKSGILGVRHVCIHAPDPGGLAEFYQEVLELQIVGQSGSNADGVHNMLLLSSQPAAKEYQLEINANPENRYTAFEVATLADLRAFYQRVIDRDLPIRWVLNHGVSLAFYFVDPAGNFIKLFWPTGIASPQPHGHPIDLNQSKGALRQDVANLVAQFELSEREKPE